MEISRRDFLRYCGISAATIGLSSLDLGLLESALANPNAPTVIWLHGAGCTGCSVSFLNRISTQAPQTAADVLIDTINLTYHPTLMSLAGESAASVAQQAYQTGGYILVVEGGVPTLFNGATCFAWTLNGQEVTFMQAVSDMASRASKIVCVGDCACFGGVSATGPNVTGVKSVQAATGKATLNIAGCPAHPDWIVWAIAQLLNGASIPVDSYGRPTDLYGRYVHGSCPRRSNPKATTFGVDNLCLRSLGCRGPATHANCPSSKWNGGVNWCTESNAPCIGCAEPGFPFSPILNTSSTSTTTTTKPGGGKH